MGLGGPLLPDKLWFYGSYRNWGSEVDDADVFHNATQGTGVFKPDVAGRSFLTASPIETTA